MKEQAVREALEANEAFRDHRSDKTGRVGILHSEEEIVYHFLRKQNFLQIRRP